MAIIHHEEVKDTYVRDPENRHQMILQTIQMPSSAVRIDWEDGRVFHVREDGSFDVDNDVAQALLRRPGWARGPNPFAPEPAEAPKPKRTKAAV